MKIYKIEEFGAVADGVFLNTVPVQKAIDHCSRAGGGQVVFSKGDYVLSTVFLKDNVEIIIEKDARILGSLNFGDYAPLEKVDYVLYQDVSHSFFHCSMFVAIDCKNIAVRGKGTIDMRSVWDEQNINNMVNRGAKVIACKCCDNVIVQGLTVLNATDLAIHFSHSQNILVDDIYAYVHIDGISLDNCKNVDVKNCQVESGDDGIVFKSTFTLNRLDICKNITVKNCRIKSRCNAIKFGTETIGGYEDFFISDCEIFDTRISGIAIESVDGAVIDNVNVSNIKMRNVFNPFFICLGKRMRAPKNLSVGEIKNVFISNVDVDGPYVPYECIPLSYSAYKKKNAYQTPWRIVASDFVSDLDKGFDEFNDWQVSPSICGLENAPIKNIKIENVKMKLHGACKDKNIKIKKEPAEYPECWAYGRRLPAKGIMFKNVQGLWLDNVNIQTCNPDVRETLVFDNVENVVVK